MMTKRIITLKEKFRQLRFEVTEGEIKGLV